MEEAHILNKSYTIGQKIQMFYTGMLIPIELTVLRIEGSKAVCKVEYIC